MAGERRDPVERRAQVGTQDIAERGPGPAERGVQVQVGDQQYPHRPSDLLRTAAVTRGVPRRVSAALRVPALGDYYSPERHSGLRNHRTDG